MYKLIVFAVLMVACTATVIVPAYHLGVPASAKVTKVEWRHPGVKYVVPASPLLSLHRPILAPYSALPHHLPFFSPFTYVTSLEKPESKTEEKVEEKKE